jgi:hypothetical protein
MCLETRGNCVTREGNAKVAAPAKTTYLGENHVQEDHETRDQKGPEQKATPAVQVKKDANGRFWLVPAVGGAEQGPFDTKKQALDANAGTPAKDAKLTKPAKAKKANEPKANKVGALEAAAQVLASNKEPMNCKEMIEVMAKQALWTSPGGKTSHATLYSAIIREIALKGKESRFVKKDWGQFAAK